MPMLPGQPKQCGQMMPCSVGQAQRVMVTQGMLRSIVVGQYYKDLKNEKYDTSFAVYHRRFSTNTNPRWPLAQPMRVLGHNGALPLSPVTTIAHFQHVSFHFRPDYTSCPFGQ